MTCYTGSIQKLDFTFHVPPNDRPDTVRYLFEGEEIEPAMFYMGLKGDCEAVVQLPVVYEEGVKYIQRIEIYPNNRKVKKDITCLTFCKSVEG